ncbi:MAG: RNA pseudouridine synthase [Saprospiraceae bacterium]|nr:RNA pseudouridine synthase [Saprospiraceae bacterium]
MYDFKIGDLVLYNDNQLLALNKPPTIPVQKDPSGDKSLLDLAEIYSKRRVHLVHRLDRPSSGITLMAKTRKALVSLNEQFKSRKIDKKYLAVVGNEPPQEEDTLIHYLYRPSRRNRAEVSEEEQADSKKSELHYRLIGKSDHYYLLEIGLITGRHHQIRAQLAHIGCPIKGDVKYGFRRGNRDRSIHLHAWKLGFLHPVSEEQKEITAPLPPDPLWSFFGEQLEDKSQI